MWVHACLKRTSNTSLSLGFDTKHEPGHPLGLWAQHTARYHSSGARVVAALMCLVVSHGHRLYPVGMPASLETAPSLEGGLKLVLVLGAYGVKCFGQQGS